MNTPRRSDECGFALIAQSFAPKPQNRPAPPSDPRLRRFLTAIAATSVAAVAAWILHPALKGAVSRDTFAPPSPELRQIWQPLIDSDIPFVLCLSSTANEPSESATAMGAFRLGQFFGDRVQHMVLTQNSATLDEPMAENAVVLGIPGPRQSYRAADLQFAFAGDVIENLHPTPGAPRFLQDSQTPDDNLPETHALISLLPAPNETGARLYLTATTSIGILAAVEAVTNPAVTDEVFARLKEPTGRLPRYFQLAISARSADHLFPSDIAYTAHKILSGRPR